MTNQKSVTMKPTRPVAFLHQHTEYMMKNGEGEDIKFTVNCICSVLTDACWRHNHRSSRWSYISTAASRSSVSEAGPQEAKSVAPGKFEQHLTSSRSRDDQIPAGHALRRAASHAGAGQGRAVPAAAAVRADPNTTNTTADNIGRPD